jgi:poly-gamma-glutamate capsule biosynthesis protein CapA/YwtB (metallophosphatase superfamily)
MLKIFFSLLLLLFSHIIHAEETDITMLFVGDIMLAERPGQLIAQGRDPFFYVRSIFRAADIRIGNLECTVSQKGKAEDKTYTFRAHPRVITTLKKYFDAVSVANNHAGDFGPVAFEDMLYQLEKKQLAYFGGGRTLRAAHEPYLTTVKGKKIAVLGYDGFFPRSFEALEDRAGVAWLDTDFIVADIKRAREVHRADWVIVVPHWGWEYEKIASSQQQTLAHLMIDSGADAVVGGHPHVTQNIEIYKNKPIIYSLGNFVFNGFHDKETTTGWIALLTLTANAEVKWKTITVRLDKNGVPHPISD